ncbi:MAG: 2-oxo-4-hydroxy-4-carboxy-5-ureidoimidazoline decarboxylase [Burkholderiales bacterium]|nr:MAG: 2-oxo-4-hydroxy-4-carboxy-5-ureidoimidazoline decarboxylase [Betaproteobacteria bacterium]TAG24572.1 MAG: 2-oxo-4-hydroxy-4-carboxy-5-ureidoimidazoline decarboxylase [Burkholderiales bacterium]
MKTLFINQINAASAGEFSRAFGAVYEHSPWIAERAFALKPIGGFASRAALHAALVATVQSASETQKLALLNAHPELAGKESAAGSLTAESTAEQASAGLTAMSAADVSQLRELNAQYRQKFGFPFIIAVRNNTQSAIFGAIKSRLTNSPAMEMNNALMQVGEIARLRLLDLVGDEQPSPPQPSP